MTRDDEGRVTECTPEEFGKLLEDYFGGRYTQAQRIEVAGWARRQPRRLLPLVYRYLVINEETSFGKPPSIKRLNANLHEVIEAYPEVREESANRMLLLEHAPDGSDLSAWFAAWRRAMERGENPAQAEDVREVLREYGVDKDGG